MQPLDMIDPMIRGGALSLLLLWSWLLLRDYRAVLAARVAVAMCAAIVAHIIATLPVSAGASATPAALRWVLAIGSVSVPPLFWLFARTWFNDAARIGRRGWLAILLTAVLVVGVIVADRTGSVLGTALAVALRLSSFGFAMLGLGEAWRGRAGDLIEARRALRLRLVGAVGAFVILTNGVEVLVYNGLAPTYWRSLIELGILMLTFGFCAAMVNLAQPMLFAPATPPTFDHAAPRADPSRLAERLYAVMAEDRAYRAEGFSIAALAAQLREPEYRVRRAINGEMGFRNFTAFLNSFRLDEVRAALADPAQREVPILTIAIDAGFGSLGPFNRAFRDAEAMTPSEYRARALNGALADSGIG